jgi:hypothetical protein
LRRIRLMHLINVTEISKLLRNAKERVDIIGVVPLDIDYEELAKVWAKTMNENRKFQIRLLCEAENFLFAKSFTTDIDKAKIRRSFDELKFIRDQCFELQEFLAEQGFFEDQKKENRQIDIEVMHLPLPLSVVRIDSKLFTAIWVHEIPDFYEEVTESHPWMDTIDSYLKVYFNKQTGRRFAAPHGTEVLELFDHKRIPRGIYPRSSFYDTDYSQLVVWALVFDRKGRLLIHRRSKNAKDNRDMWDKSVGGHIDFSLDVDSSRAVLREVIEELFTDELKKQDIKAWDVVDESMLYLGEWRPLQRKRFPFREIAHLGNDWAFFRVKESQRLYSPRTMPDGRIRRLRVIADVFLFVAGPMLTDKSLGDLENSEYKLISLKDLKTVMDRSLREESVKDFDKYLDIPKFSPDLTNIMTGELRGILEEFSQFIQRYIKN